MSIILKKSKLKNRHKKKVIVSWCHISPDTTSSKCGIIKPGKDEDAPEIGDNVGYLTLQAKKELKSTEPEPVESKITIAPFEETNYSVILSYNKNDNIWKIEAVKKNGNGSGVDGEDSRQIGINIEIGPRA